MQLDLVFARFLRAVGLSNEEALLNFGLSPLTARRDIAMLGLIHRTVIGEGSEQFRRFFVLANRTNHPDGRRTLNSHDMQLRTYRTGKFLDLVGHSLLGAIDVYNLLPPYVVAAKDVKTFQNRLQQILKLGASEGMPGWTTFLSNRHLTFLHPLRMFNGFEGPGEYARVGDVNGDMQIISSHQCVQG